MVNGELDYDLVVKDLQSVQEVLSVVLENIYAIGIIDMSSLATLLGDGFFEDLAKNTYYFTVKTYTVEEYNALTSIPSSAEVTPVYDETDGTTITGYEVKTFDFDYDADGTTIIGLPDRSDFASELVAGVLKRIITNENLSTDKLIESFGSSSSEELFGSSSTAEVTFDDMFFYDNDHFYANMIEGAAFDNLIYLFSYFSDQTVTDEHGMEMTYRNTSMAQADYAAWINEFNIQGLDSDWYAAYDASGSYTDNLGDSEVGRSYFEIVSYIPFSVSNDSGSSVTLTLSIYLEYGESFDIENATTGGFLNLATFVSSITYDQASAALTSYAQSSILGGLGA